RQQLEQVIAWLRARLPTLGHQPPLHLINCRNGLLDWRTGTLTPHTPRVLSTNQLPIAWNPDATCLTIRRFFAETLPWDTLDLIEELFGYALYPGNPFRKAVLLFGLGANGKVRPSRPLPGAPGSRERLGRLASSAGRAALRRQRSLREARQHLRR